MHSLRLRDGLLAAAMSASAMLVAGLVGTGAAAQDSQTTAERDRTPVCMARALRDVPQVRAEQRGQPFQVVTVERAVQTLEARGFVRVDCATADLARADRRASWRDEICKLASTGNEAAQRQLARAYGEKPAVLCAMAEQVAGPWERGGARSAD